MQYRIAAALVFVVTLCSVRWGTERLADVVARELAGALPVARGREVNVVAPAPLEEVAPRPQTPVAELTPAASMRAKPRGRARAARQKEPVLHGIHVSQESLLRIVNRGVRPSGHFVPASGARPAGIELAGVGALSVGLRDGDVLTHAAGTPVHSPAAVIGVVIAARAAGAKEISGRFWRDGQPWTITVAQPYLREELGDGTAAAAR